VVQPLPRAQRHVALPISIHDEHVGAAHPPANAQANPFIRRRRLELEIHAAGAGRGSRLRNAPLEANLVGDGAVGRSRGIGI
jgi:hypothetical protein